MKDEHPLSQSDSLATPLLWTGGWDSTFRLLSLLIIERREVQPYYVVDRPRDRPGVPAEREAMRRIRDLIRSRYPDAIDRLRPTIECAVAEIPPNEALTQHYEGCLKSAFIGGQYEWLARYCAAHDIDAMELAIHRDDKARELLAGLIDATRMKLDSRHSGDSRYELFRRFKFGLFDTTKQQMRAESARAGFDDLMKLTWFCHRPRRGQPCGTCNPCIYTIEEGLGDRVPLAGRIRYEIRIVPRIRHWLARHPDLYLKIRALYRRIKPRRVPAVATTSPQSLPRS
jgi:hypothetical protein